ncbi:hypothetical protein GOV04_02365 [Candidatus Woesearchaeota archaeon]|nr:hypothetical protein [Candidatus Woesearchaeota archaeon]
MKLLKKGQLGLEDLKKILFMLLLLVLGVILIWKFYGAIKTAAQNVFP